jgi:threonine/homoserine/homoserine lactone efflux protein
MSFEAWLAFALISAANIVTPGPAILNTIRRAAQLGFKQCLPTIAANAVGLAVAGFACAFGVAAFVLASEWLWFLFRWAGVLYLAYLGLRLIFVRETLDLGPSTSARPSVSATALFLEAFTLAVSNPKAVLFFVAIFPQVIQPGLSAAPQAVVLVSTYSAISLASLTTYAALAGLLRARLLTQPRYRGFRVLSGIVLLGFAGKLAKEVR